VKGNKTHDALQRKCIQVDSPVGNERIEFPSPACKLVIGSERKFASKNTSQQKINSQEEVEDFRTNGGIFGADVDPTG